VSATTAALNPFASSRKTFTSAIVEFPAAARAAPHSVRFMYAYVLAGTVSSWLEGEPIRTYRAGESWFERRTRAACSRRAPVRRSRQSF
jgi:quercetin dioxygenase-like cupin family protein